MSKLQFEWPIPEHLSHVSEREWEMVLADALATAITRFEEREVRRQIEGTGTAEPVGIFGRTEATA